MKSHVLALAAVSVFVSACSSSSEQAPLVYSVNSANTEKKDAPASSHKPDTAASAAKPDAAPKPDVAASTGKKDVPASSDAKPAAVNAAKQDATAKSDKPANTDKKEVPNVDTTTANSFYSLRTKTLEGKDADLAAYKGKVVLVVNTASECGFTLQYEGLETLQKKLESRGFTVLGFPSNDFGKQEPGDAAKIRDFCTSKYSVTFPLFEKLVTKAGPDQSPIYAYLGGATGKLPAWNFSKYLIGKDGKPIAFYGSKVTPEDTELAKAIETALAAK